MDYLWGVGFQRSSSTAPLSPCSAATNEDAIEIEQQITAQGEEEEEFCFNPEVEQKLLKKLLKRIDALETQVDVLQSGRAGVDASESSERSEASQHWLKLEECYEEYERDVNSQPRRDLVFLHPEEVGKRDYTANELDRTLCRPYPSRLFITNIQIDWNTVWLRTRHTDHHDHNSSFILMRDALKADAITNNRPGAKYALTELLNMCIGMEASDYYSFACTIASAFSNGGENIDFAKQLLMHPARTEQIHQTLQRLRASKPPESLRLANAKSTLEHELLHSETLRSRRRLIQMMDIVFGKLGQKRLMLDDGRENIYRLVHCMTKYSRAWYPYTFALFSFFFQGCSAASVFLSLTDLDNDHISITGQWFSDPNQQNWYQQHLALAVGTLFYGAMVACPEIMATRRTWQTLYRNEFGAMQLMDFVINCILPVVVALCGFLVVLQSLSFLEGVLNAVALLFITEIDDYLPALLELDKTDIVQGFLIDQAMQEYRDQDLNKEIPEIDFSDLHITNTPESGSIPSSGITFQPYEVFGDALTEQQGPVRKVIAGHKPLKRANADSLPTRQSHHIDRRGSTHLEKKRNVARYKKASGGMARYRQGNMGQQIANKRLVSEDCLLRKIEWQYTGHPKGLFAAASSPRIGHLILHKLVGGPPIEIRGKQKAPLSANKPWYSITGVYMITSFGMSDDVLRLRVCGSQSSSDFLRAFRYYNLWPLEPSAKRLLKKTTITMSQEEKENNQRVLYGTEPDFKEEESVRSLADAGASNSAGAAEETYQCPNLGKDILRGPVLGSFEEEFGVSTA